MGVIGEVAAALRSHGDDAVEAKRIFSEWSGPLPRVPGMDTVARLAYRVSLGRTPAEAAGREYAYRWKLALRAPRAFGVPHTLGM